MFSDERMNDMNAMNKEESQLFLEKLERKREMQRIRSKRYYDNPENKAKILMKQKQKRKMEREMLLSIQKEKGLEVHSKSKNIRVIFLNANAKIDANTNANTETNANTDANIDANTDANIDAETIKETLIQLIFNHDMVQWFHKFMLNEL